MNDVMIVIISTFAIATVLNIILRKFGVPTIIGYIFTGVVITSLFGLEHTSNEIKDIAEFGIVFLMFTIGLEFSIAHLKSMKEEVFLNGLLQITLSSLIFFIIIHIIIGIDTKSSIIIASAISLSSTAIVLKVLNESDKINTTFGKKALGILLFQDIAVIPILLMVDIFTNSTQSISTLLFYTLINAIIALSIMFIFGKYIVEKFLEVSSKSNEIYIASILLIVLASSYLAHTLGFSYSLGAFIAGMTIAETKYKHQIEADLIPFRDLLLGLFFITIGMGIDINLVMDNILLILLLVVLIMSIKALIIYFVIIFKSYPRVAFKSALSLSQIGEFSLVILSLASGYSLLDNSIVQILIPSIVISMIFTPFILNHLADIVDIIIKEEPLEVEVSSGGYNNHIIVCGYSATGKSIVKKLKKRKIPYIIIEHNIKLVEQAKRGNKNIIFGNATQTSLLEKLDVKKASSVIITMENFKKITMIIDRVKSISSDIDVIAKVVNKKEVELLKEYNLKHVLNRSDIMSDILLDEALSCKL
ncbi:Glutathione-regulated potassium-efflux system protein KefB [hydrothermal vent metagenome]|uniref:Glutathione-regulated potassium-efflux system protein KefB n=1 Tax=hydrothermal vent metagenome TaxID=652676 RepID=A0A1W1EI71_9ZZZZ